MHYIYLIILFPFIGFLFNGFFGRKLPEKLVGTIGSSMIFASFIVSLMAFIEAYSNNFKAVEYVFFNWISAGDFNVDFAFRIDAISLLMAMMVSFVAFLIHLYSIGYMHKDKGFGRYFAYLNLFCFMMLILVMANNFLLMFVGWEGVGLCSYLLIGFWYEDKEKAYAGMKAFIVNRIGDFGFILAMLLIFINFGTLHFASISKIFSAQAVTLQGTFIISAISLLLFLGATGKSAQLPLYVWLPDAMAGPTPVSALIHAATMVTAGVYMIARTSFIYVLSPFAMMIVAVVGVFTAIFAATIAINQRDIKKVLAYSTVSQLGYMFTAVGVGAFSAGMFHLLTHAFFKSLLFLGAGSVIHAMNDEQDMFFMGGLKSKMPITFYTMLIATCAISGIPLFSGFFSKDEILWQAFGSPIGSFWIWLVATIAAGITSFYMFRLIFLTFLGKKRWKEGKHPHESPKIMTIPLIILAVLSIVGGYIGVPHALGGHNIIHKYLSVELSKIPAGIHHSINLELLLMAGSVLIALIGISIAYLFYIKNTLLPEKISKKTSQLNKLLFNKYYIDEIYSFIILKPILNISKALWKFFDCLIIDGAVNGVGRLALNLGAFFRRFQTGFVQHYAAFVFLGIIFILFYYIFI